jgi:hypothetical protein
MLCLFAADELSNAGGGRGQTAVRQSRMPASIRVNLTRGPASGAKLCHRGPGAARFFLDQKVDRSYKPDQKPLFPACKVLGRNPTKLNLESF